MKNTIQTGVTIKEGYMGGFAFTGCNYHGYMRYSEINKIVKKAFKEKFPETKVSCTGSSYSGGQDCDGIITITIDEIYTKEEYTKLATEKCYQPNASCWYGNKWGETLSLEERISISYDCYLKRLTGSGENMNHIYEIDNLILKPTAIEKVNYLNALYDSFNDCDNNGMVDYFDNLFYKSVEVKLG